MKKFRLTNLRDLTSEEQVMLNGGSMSQLCDHDCGECSCTCKCNGSTSESNADSSADTGALAKDAAKERQAMVQ